MQVRLPITCIGTIIGVQMIGGFKLSVICGTYELQATESLNPPIIWTPIIVPVQVIGNRTCTVVLPSDQMRYFQLRRP